MSVLYRWRGPSIVKLFFLCFLFFFLVVCKSVNLSRWIDMKIPSYSINFGFLLSITPVCHIWREEKCAAKQEFTILNKIIVIFFSHETNMIFSSGSVWDQLSISFFIITKAFPAYLSSPFFSLPLCNVQCCVPEILACLFHQNLGVLFLFSKGVRIQIFGKLQ